MKKNNEQKCIDEFQAISEGHKIVVSALAYAIHTIEIVQMEQSEIAAKMEKLLKIAKKTKKK